MKRSDVLGVPFVLIAHAIILTILIGLLEVVVISQLVAKPIASLDSKVTKLERPTVTVTPVVPTVSPTLSPSVTKQPARTIPASGSGVVK